MKWYEAVAKVSPYMVKIETPSGHGTGFLCLLTRNNQLYGIATADHVVSEAHYWQQPIRIRPFASNDAILVQADKRVIFSGPESDSAIILMKRELLKFPDELLPLLPSNQMLKIGVEVGWLGYPSVAPTQLCFFEGSISARQRKAYFIDGVAINGVSGGPVFDIWDKEIRIIGIIFAYHYNVTASTVLPGLSFAQDVSYLHATISELGSMEEARQKEREQEKKPPTPSIGSPPVGEPSPGGSIGSPPSPKSTQEG